MVPHGCARNFVASVICMMAGPMDIFVPGGVDGRMRRNRDLRLDVAHSHFQSWLDATGQHVRDMKEFTVENLGWSQNRSFPDMSCKAADTTLMIQWLIDFLTKVPFERCYVLEVTLDGLQGIDEFQRQSYTGDRVFWDRLKQREGMYNLGRFLASYVKLGAYWHNRRWTLFHFTAHWHEALRQSVSAGNAWALSPGAFATPLMEDFIGRMSRIARTAHPSSVARTVINKYLVEVKRVWRQRQL